MKKITQPTIEAVGPIDQTNQTAQKNSQAKNTQDRELYFSLRSFKSIFHSSPEDSFSIYFPSFSGVHAGFHFAGIQHYQERLGLPGAYDGFHYLHSNKEIKRLKKQSSSHQFRSLRRIPESVGYCVRASPMVAV